MLERYICPDGAECEIASCLQECRLKDKLECGRCLSQRMLEAMSRQRDWSGIPTVTQLLNGTRAEFLKLTKGYAASPQNMVAAYFGSNCHANIEAVTDNDRFLCEQRLLDPTNTYSGQFDCYDTQDGILYDTKTFGSFKAASVLGIKKVREPLVDPVTGEIELTPRGRVKQRTEYVQGMRQTRDVTLQLNSYRLMLEANGYPVKEMRLEIIVRDGGTWIAKDRGVKQNALLVRINRISDSWLQKFMLNKAHRLIYAVEHKKMPPPCRPIETWGGLKCKNFCNVSAFCQGGLSN